MLFLCVLFAFMAAAIHGFIFYLEVLRFGSSKFQQVFRLPENDLPKVKAAFNNLGVYNLGLSIAVLAGLVLLLSAQTAFANGMAFGLLSAALGIMVLAGAYLAYSQADKRRAACIQAVPALLALLCLAWAA